MTKKLETRWAEVIFVVLITIVLMSSCGTTSKYGCGGSPIHLGN